MNDIGTLVRLFNPSPDDDFVTKRASAVADLKERFRSQRNLDQIHRNVSGLVEGLVSNLLPEQLADLVESSIQKFSSSFVREGEATQLTVCAFAAARDLVAECKPTNNGSSTPELFVAAMLSALTGTGPLHPPKLEDMRRQIIEQSTAIVEQSAEESRQRRAIPEPSLVASDDETIATLAPKIKATVEKVVAPLKFNAALDREELDLLWWALSDWSSVASRPVSTLSPAERLIACSIDTVSLLRRIPATAHVHVALSKIQPAQPVGYADLVSAANVLRGEVQRNAGFIAAGLQYPRVFPLIAALFGENSPPFWQQDLPSADWCKRLILEAGILRLQKTQAA